MFAYRSGVGDLQLWPFAPDSAEYRHCSETDRSHPRNARSLHRSSADPGQVEADRKIKRRSPVPRAHDGGSAEVALPASAYRMWGYSRVILGPTIEAWRNQAISVRWENQLPKRHLFEIDASSDSAMLAHQLRLSRSAPEVRAVTHLHGARSKSKDDGLPENWYTPGHSVTSHYPNEQQATTLFYHDHALCITRLNVYAGLSGFYLLRDEQEHTEL